MRAVMPEQREPVLPVADDQHRQHISGRVVPGAGQSDGADHDRPVEQGVLQPRPGRPLVEIFQLVRGYSCLCGARGRSLALGSSLLDCEEPGYFLHRK